MPDEIEVIDVVEETEPKAIPSDQLTPLFDRVQVELSNMRNALRRGEELQVPELVAAMLGTANRGTEVPLFSWRAWDVVAVSTGKNWKIRADMVR